MPSHSVLFPAVPPLTTRTSGTGAVILSAIALTIGLTFGACDRDAPEPTPAASPVAPPEAGATAGAAPPNAAPSPNPAPSASGARPNAAPPVRADGTVYAESELMGTHFSINLWLDPDRTAFEAGAAIQAALDEVARIERLTSEWMADSELSRLNDAAGTSPIPLSPELFAVLARSREISEASGGAFDVTFHGVGVLWTFTPGSKPPDDAAIAERLPLVDWRRIELDADARTGRLARAGMKVGLGAIAKGYAVDRASDLLKARGFSNHVVEGGGDTYASGTKGGKPWMVGIQAPGREGVVGALPSSDIAVVTSGNYQRFFEFEGIRYAHILDPHTGQPLREEASFTSITLVAANATDADGFATAVAVMGPERGMAYVESRPELEAVLITRDGRVSISSGLTDRFVWAPAKPEPKPKPAPEPQHNP